ncbi:MAG TPA: glycosyltransferase family 2 protein [Patescibacteria group bacterium]|nr:glycosyltransferase family 2 protein [Patescibacteria group bacterium]
MKKIKSLSIIVPCYNEEGTLKDIVKEVLGIDIGHIEKEIILIDDCSTDGTIRIIKSLAEKHPEIKAFYQGKNQGKGAALKVGFNNSTGDLVIVQDADREYDPRDYKKLINLFSEDRADVVIGSRFSGGQPKRVAYLANTIANKFMTRLSALMSGLYVSDIHSCYIMFDGEWIRRKAPSLKSKRYGFNPEIIAKIANEKNTLRICEVGISYFPRTKEEGKKIGVRDGLKALWEIFYYNTLSR